MNNEKKRILLVDDDEDVLKTLSAYLTSEGYSVDTAKTGKEAISKSKEHFFNLAVLDIKLPDMEGTGLLTSMRETQPKMVKIMLTGYPDLGNCIKSINGDADVYIVKPAQPKDLAVAIKRKLEAQDKEDKMDQGKIVRYIESRAQQKRDNKTEGQPKIQE